MDLQLLRQPPGLCWLKHLIEGGGRVRIQIIHHQDDLVGLGILHVDQLAHKQRPVACSASLPHLEEAFACQWFAGHKQVTVPIGIILIVDAFRMTRLHRQGLTQVRDQLFAPLIQTDLWTTFIVGARVDLQDVFHMIHKVGIGLWWNAPVVLEPGLQFVFFNTCRTVSWLTLSTSSSSTSLSATRRKLQRSYPSGAWPHSSAIRCASCSPSSLRFSCRGGCGLRLSAASKPPCTKLRRTRCTVVSPTSRASWICRADQRGPSGPQSALSRIRAWVSLRAGACPALIKAARSRRCSWVKRMLFFFMEVSLSGLNSSFSFKDTSFFASDHIKLDGLVGADLSCTSPIYRPWCRFSCPRHRVNVHTQSHSVTLSAAKGLARQVTRCFAECTLSATNGLSMTGLDLSVDEELSRSFEPCLKRQSGRE